MYIYRVNVLIKGEENLMLEEKIDTVLKDSLTNSLGEHISSTIVTIEGTNFGKCVKCGCFCSDRRKKDYIVDFSCGAIVNGKWFCDICLPLDHPNSF